MKRNICISDVCRWLGLSYQGEEATINGLNLCNRNSAFDRVLSYVVNKNYLESVMDNTHIVCLVLPEELVDVYSERNIGRKLTYILSEEPEKSYYDIHEYLWEKTDFYDKYDFPAQIGVGCEIHPTAVIEEGVIIGNRAVIGANTVVRKGTVIMDGCMIGCNTTIGSEGFQVLRSEGRNYKVTHCGGVRLENNVCIGDNVTVCNALFEGDVCIGSRAKIDNLVHIAHNVTVGPDAVVTAGTMLCGSSMVGEGAWIGVNSSILNRVTVGNDAMVGIGSVVTRNVPDSALVYGVPAKEKNLVGG